MEALAIRRDLPAHKCPPNAKAIGPETMQLNSVASVSLGGVTGDASFFLMNDSRRKELELPIDAVRPVVSKTKHLRCAVLNDADWESLRKSGERVWLFNPSPRMAKHPAVKHYMQLAAEEGGCDRLAFKVRVRRPWYRTPMPLKPDAFLSGMSQTTPWICLNETQKVNATNTLYVIRFRTGTVNEWYKWCLAILSTKSWNQIRRLGRRYADGLVKWEPGSLGAIKLPIAYKECDFEALYKRAIKALFAKDTRLARDIADSVLLSR